MAKKTSENIQSYDQIISDLRNKIYKPVYLLTGMEPYYIDLISDFIQKNVLSETEKEFNLSVLYGEDTNMTTVVNEAKRFPMMSPYQVIIVKEAQSLFKNGGDLDILSYYLQKPLQSTILVFCYKYGVLDKRKKVYSNILNAGVIFQSDVIRDYQVALWIKNYVKQKGWTIEEKATSLLAEYVGTDLSRIVSNLDKLIISNNNIKNITCDLIEKNIGISKDYNNFELQDAIERRDILKANRIVNYFANNIKNNPIFPTISILFGFYYNLLIYHYTDNKIDSHLASRLGVNPFFIKGYKVAAMNYNARKCMENISILREYDTKAKGVSSIASTEDLFREMIFRLMH